MEAHNGELGPIDIVVIAYPAGAPMTGSAVPLLLDLVERRIIRVLDVLFVTKDEDGTFSGFAAHDLDDKGVGDFAAFEGASSGLLSEEDVEKTAETIEPGSAAVVIVYENAGRRRSRTRSVATAARSSRTTHPVQDVPDALDAVEAAS